jgi:hypothetical protein
MEYNLLDDETKSFIEKKVDQLAEDVVNQLHLQLLDKFSHTDPEFYPEFKTALYQAQAYIIKTLIKE